MKLEKAIEIKEIFYNSEEMNNYDDYRKADWMSITAMKKIKAVREGKEWVGINLLPGETEE